MPSHSSTPSFHADRVYVLAKANAADPPEPGELLWRLLGAGAATRCHERPHAADARVFMRDGAWRVLVPARLQGPALGMALARAIARWYVLTQLPDDADTPDVDGIAAAVALPDAAIAHAVEQVGQDAEAIAAWLVLPLDVVVARMRDAAAPSRSGLYPSVRLKAHAPPESAR